MDIQVVPDKKAYIAAAAYVLVHVRTGIIHIISVVVSKEQISLIDYNTRLKHIMGI